MAATGIKERSRTAEVDDAAAAKIAGIWCPVLTPVDQNLKPDAARFVAQLASR